MKAEDCLTLFGMIGAVWAFFVGLRQYREGQKWKKTEFVLSEIRNFESSIAIRNVLIMLEYHVRWVELFPNHPDYGQRWVKVDDAMIERALAVHKPDTQFDKNEIAIRDSFDVFFTSIQRFANYVKSGIVTASDLRVYLEYWLNLVVGRDRNLDQRKELREAMSKFIDEYNYADVRWISRELNDGEKNK